MVRIALLLAATTVVGATTAVAGVARVAAAPVDAPSDAPWTVPETPPRCTREQADAGDVAGCLLVANVDPEEHGWGTPPAPNVGPGWSWSGWSYAGSDALAGWEAEFIDHNDRPVAGARAGSLRTHVAAAALFEGFLAEIAARGYRVTDVGGYSFRCTEGNGGWDCPSRDREDLSNHAWGLAIDMNAGTNPIRSYRRIGTTTACATPIETDLPRWVVQTAEKWGLYWGGYGWSSGCADATTERDVVFRDPPHFEFRGSVDQALAIAAHNGAAPRPRYCAPTVTAGGRDVTSCNRLGRPGTGWRTPVELAAPAGAVAALVNVTAADGTAGGYLTLEPCGARPDGDRSTSNTNYAGGRDAANAAIVPLGGDARVCVFRSAPSHSIVDVSGYLVDARTSPGASWFLPADPVRLDDTRLGAACTPQGECAPGKVRPAGTVAIGPPSGATAVLNLTATEPASAGFLTAGACAALAGEVGHSTLNHPARSDVANMAIVDASERLCVYASAETHVLVDQVGSLDPVEGFGWRLVPARRMLDTRTCDTCGGRVPAGGVVRVPLGTTAPGAVVNLTVTGSDAAGYATVGSCAVLRPGREPATSTLNHDAGGTVANMAFVAAGGGDVCVYTRAAAHVIVDVQAELVAEQPVGAIAVPPIRVHDSRHPGGGRP